VENKGKFFPLNKIVFELEHYNVMRQCLPAQTQVVRSLEEMRLSLFWVVEFLFVQLELRVQQIVAIYNLLLENVRMKEENDGTRWRGLENDVSLHLTNCLLAALYLGVDPGEQAEKTRGRCEDFTTHRSFFERTLRSLEDSLKDCMQSDTWKARGVERLSDWLAEIRQKILRLFEL